MRRGRALGAWVLLASLAVASWGVQGKSPGISLCPQAAAVPVGHSPSPLETATRTADTAAVGGWLGGRPPRLAGAFSIVAA